MLTARKEALELLLKEKTEELRQICFREAVGFFFRSFLSIENSLCFFVFLFSLVDVSPAIACKVQLVGKE